jgi:hypothetical protein
MEKSVEEMYANMNSADVKAMTGRDSVPLPAPVDGW